MVWQVFESGPPSIEDFIDWPDRCAGCLEADTKVKMDVGTLWSTLGYEMGVDSNQRPVKAHQVADSCLFEYFPSRCGFHRVVFKFEVTPRLEPSIEPAVQD